MFGNDAEDEFKFLLGSASPTEHAEIVRALGVIEEHFGTVAAGVEEIIAHFSNPDLAAQSWDAARAVIQAAKGRGGRC